MTTKDENWRDHEYRLYVSYNPVSQQILSWVQSIEEDGQTAWANHVELDAAGTIHDYRRALWPVAADLRAWVRAQ